MRNNSSTNTQTKNAPHTLRFLKILTKIYNLRDLHLRPHTHVFRNTHTQSFKI